MTNLQIAIEKALDALKPQEYAKFGEIVTVTPAYIGQLQRRTVEMLVDAALKYQEALEKRQAECAYPVPCKQCIHQVCGSYRDNAVLAPLTDTLTPIDIMLAYAETVL